MWAKSALSNTRISSAVAASLAPASGPLPPPAAATGCSACPVLLAGNSAGAPYSTTDTFLWATAKTDAEVQTAVYVYVYYDAIDDDSGDTIHSMYVYVYMYMYAYMYIYVCVYVYVTVC